MSSLNVNVTRKIGSHKDVKWMISFINVTRNVPFVRYLHFDVIMCIAIWYAKFFKYKYVVPET